MSEESISARLERIESHLAHLEHLCDQLNEIVIAQGEKLQRLQVQQQRLGSSLETIEIDRIKQTDAKPPHYQ